MQHDHCSSSLPTRGTALTVEAVEASQGAAERTAPLKQQQVDTDVLLLGRRFRRWARMSQIRLSPMAMMPQMFLLMIMVVLVTTRLHVANAWSSSISLFAPNRNTVYRRRLSSRGGHKCRKSVWSATTSASASASASASVSLAHDLPSSTTNISTNLEHSLMDTTGGSIPPSSLSATATPQRRIPFRGALSMSIPELAQHLGGTGRAKLVWDCYSLGIDPALYFSEPSATSTKAEASTSHNDSTSTSNGDLSKLFPGSRRHQRLGADALHKLSALYADYSNTATATATEAATATATTASIAMLDGGVATLTKVIQSQDGTTKLLLHLSDQTAVETVIIPVYQQQEPEPAIRPPEQQGKGDEPISKTRNRQPQYKALHSRSTVCISSQVGCRQACTFCATGRMGKVRSLTTDEILVQYFFALQVVRLSSSASATAPSLDTPIKNAVHRALPPISNVVFMGMGEPADNVEAVNGAVKQLTTRELFQLSATKVTVSTVAPTPDAFAQLSQLSKSTSSSTSPPCVLAWSVHAARDDLRRQLVPTTRYKMVELRQGLIDTLLQRPRNFRTTMLEVALIDQINDSIVEAEELADFCRGILDAVPDCKLMVNLIPWNDIGGVSGAPDSVHALGYRKPSPDRVEAFQRHLWSRGIYTHVRATRGDEESAACGQLATPKTKRATTTTTIG